jgi:hypothetical protein
VLDRMFHATFVYLSCIADLYVYSTLEPRTNSYVAPYVVVFFERKHCVTLPLIISLSLPLYLNVTSIYIYDLYST